MNTQQLLAEVAHLGSLEKVLLVEAVWDQIEDDALQTFTESQLREISSRDKIYRNNISDCIPAAELIQRLKKG